MKQFRHKPTGKIFVENGAGGVVLEGTNSAIPAWIAKGNDWEELVAIDESKWFIKEFRNKTYGTIWKILSDGKSYGTATEKTKSPLSFFIRTMNDYAIHSVTRIQDSKTFTVGDVLIVGNNASNLQKIISIEQYKEGFALLHKKEGNQKLFIALGNAVKWVEPEYAYETADSVTLKKFDDKLYKLLTKSNWDKGTTTVDAVERANNREGAINAPSSSWLYFSTPEAREEYILNHKPLICLADLKTFEDVKISSKSIGNLKEHIAKRL